MSAEGGSESHCLFSWQRKAAFASTIWLELYLVLKHVSGQELLFRGAELHA